MKALLCGFLALAFTSACSPATNARPDTRDAPDAAFAADSGTSDGDAGTRDADLDGGKSDDAGFDAGGAADAGVPCTEANRAKARCCGGPSEGQVDVCTGDHWTCSCPVGSPDCDVSSMHVVFAFDLPLHCGASHNTPEAGVPCGGAGQLCAPGRWCCDAIAENCRDTPDGISRDQLSCDGPEDCAGQLCCADVNRNPLDPQLGLVSACAAACGVEQVRLCNVDADCGDGLKCCAGRKYPTGLCRAACLE